MNVTRWEDATALLRISIRADCNGRTPSIDLQCIAFWKIRTSRCRSDGIWLFETWFWFPCSWFIEAVKMQGKTLFTKTHFKCSFSSFKTEQQISVDVNKCINKYINPKAAVSKAAAVIVVCGFSSTWRETHFKVFASSASGSAEGRSNPDKQDITGWVKIDYWSEAGTKPFWQQLSCLFYHIRFCLSACSQGSSAHPVRGVCRGWFGYRLDVPC